MYLKCANILCKVIVVERFSDQVDLYVCDILTDNVARHISIEVARNDEKEMQTYEKMMKYIEKAEVDRSVNISPRINNFNNFFYLLNMSR